VLFAVKPAYTKFLETLNKQSFFYILVVTMSTKKYLLYLFLLFGCGSANQEKEVKVFLTEWSNALMAKDESVRRFYDANFIFPKVIFEGAEGLNYSFDVNHIDILSEDDNGDLHIIVPFRIAGPDSTNVEQSNIELRIAKTANGFVIRDMTQELAVKIKEHSLRLQQANIEHSEVRLRYDSLLSGIQKSAISLSEHYDSVVFFTDVGDQVLFYVINGSWEFPYEYNKQRDGGNYKMGVVTAENKVIIPVAYTKIYNPNGSFNEMIEVENDGLRGLFHIRGEAFLSTEFDGIYPTTIQGAFAQVKKGEDYGWVASNGVVTFDPSSHPDKRLFQSPIETKAILEWEFQYPGSVDVLIDPYGDSEMYTGVIIYPSFIRDLGITTIANADVALETSEYGMGMTDTVIKFEKTESLSDQLFALISFFMEAGADARGYHSTQNDLLVVDKNLNKISHQEKLTADGFEQDPCGENHPQYKMIEPGLYESKDGHGTYNYYKITAEGTVEQLTTDRQYNFTKFAKIDESYFGGCHHENLEYADGQWESDRPNLVVVSGISIEEIDVMRNEIFAEYGFIFKSPKWKDYFSAKSWYKPQYDNVDQFLTETDKYNIKFLLEYQRLHKGQTVQRDSIQFMWAG
jgi:hypothetical protein